MDRNKIIELSHTMIPGREPFKLEARVEDVTAVLPDVIHRPDVWYVLGEITYCTHVGTHIEVPFHHLKNGDDVSQFPIHNLIGRLRKLDFRHKGHLDAITLDELVVYDTRIRERDIVFFHTGMDEYYRTERWNEQPYLTAEANQWLIEKRIACLGTDAAGMEIPGTDRQPNHQAIFTAGIPMVESLTNLEAIDSDDEYTVFILPLAIQGIEASPLRVIAIRQEDIHEL